MSAFSTKLHGVTLQQTVTFVVSVVTTLNLSLSEGYITPLHRTPVGYITPLHRTPTLCSNTLSHCKSLHPFKRSDLPHFFNTIHNFSNEPPCTDNWQFLPKEFAV